MKRVYICIALLIATFVADANAQSVGLKTNLLYGGLTLTPNIAVEVGLANRMTIDVAAGYNPWKVEEHTRKLAHWMGQVELRYWFCEKFNGPFIGIHALGSQFNIAEYNLPWLFGENSKNFQFKGDAYGGGVSFGYQFILARRWNLELNAGVGYARINYDKYDCLNSGRFVESSHKDYFGPTRAGVSITFLIGRGK